MNQRLAEYDESMNPPPPSGRRIAFFGGSFDPPHLGHLAVARAARTALELDTVLFAPVGAQPLKAQGSTASFEDRVAMTRLTIADEAGFAVSLADAPKSSGKPNFTLETLAGLRSELTADCKLFCLMGADSFGSLRHWHRAAEIPFAAPLIVASRPGEQLDDLEAFLPTGLSVEDAPKHDRSCSGVEIRCYLLRNQAGERTPFYLLPGLDVEISASEIRAQLRSAPDISPAGPAQLAVGVSEYIRSRGLYR
jgi:nicotinate-nucleotide adenylyltransferase